MLSTLLPAAGLLPLSACSGGDSSQGVAPTASRQEPSKVAEPELPPKVPEQEEPPSETCLPDLSLVLPDSPVSTRHISHRMAANEFHIPSRHTRVPSFLLLFLTIGTRFCFVADAATDWPQFLGPDRNGVYAAKDLSKTWPKEGPPKVWEKKVGQGFSGPVVADGKLVLFHRIGEKETVNCFDAKSGNPVWTFDYRTAYRDDFGFDEGPRATPAIANGKVFTFGAEGALHCIDFATGKKLWNVNTKEQFSAAKGFFGMACSPLVEGNHVLINIGGGNGAGIVAFDVNSGKLAWKSTDHEASYSSPVAATVGGMRSTFFFTRNGLVVLDPSNGKVQSEFPWRPRMNASVNAATPLVIDNYIFVSTSYHTGGIVLAMDGNKLKKIWSSDDALSNHYATSVHRGGFLYGFHGRQEEGPSLHCVDLKTGQVMWSRDQIPAGTITLADDRLLLVLEDGRAMFAPASSEGFKLVAEAQLLPFGVRAYPALARGCLYARSKDKLACFDLK